MVELSAEQQQALRDADPALKRIKAEIDRAKRAGIDTTALEAAYAEADRLRRGLVREYAPTAVRARRGTS